MVSVGFLPPNLGSVSSLNGQELEIFRAGNYGPKGTYTAADLQQLASGYNPTQHEVPLVIGHPKVADRAYGWCRTMRADGDKLFATFQQVPPAVDQAVREGAYKKRSVAVTRGADGKLFIRHVGLLGAMKPEITGMPDAKFGDEEFEEFEFNSNSGDHGMAGEQEQQERNAFMDRLMKFFSGEPKATQTIDIEKLKTDLKTELTAAGDTKLTALQTEFADYKAKHEKSDKAANVTAAITKLKSENRWLPAFDRMGVPELFAAVAEGSTEEFEFADTDKTKKKLDPLAALTSIIGGFAKILPKDTVFSDEAIKESVVTPPADTVVNGVSTDPGSQQFDAAIKARMKEDKVDYATAHRRLTSEGKSSTSYATTSAGAV